MPNPFLLGAGWTWIYPSYSETWSADIWEFPRSPNSVFPHSTLCLTQNFYARDCIILYSELATIIAAMRNRVKQPKVDPNGGDTQEALFNELEEYISRQFRHAFPMEKGFPVLILSYVGPQHARFLYAYMERRQLVIRLSRLYKFERKATAPLDLFARVLLSRPLTE